MYFFCDKIENNYYMTLNICTYRGNNKYDGMGFG